MLTIFHAVQQSTTIVFPNWMATLLTSLVLLALLAKFGNSISKYYKLDDVLRVFVAVIGVAGALYATPRFQEYAKDISTWAKNSFGGWTTVGILVVVGLMIWAIGAYLKEAKPLRLVFVILLTIPLFINPTMRNVAIWFSDHIGSWTFREIIKFIMWAAGT
jgi:hypothetical protein